MDRIGRANLKRKTQTGIPLLTCRVPAGSAYFPDDHVDRMVDIHQELVKRPSSTEIWRVAGESMIEAGILDGDYIVVDRRKRPKDRDIVMALVDGESTVKRLRLTDGKLALFPENPDHSPISVGPENDFEIYGVVVGSYRINH